MCKIFYYKNYNFNATTGELYLTYQYQDHLFTETITFPKAPFNLSQQQLDALQDVFFLTHIAFGISYYKAFLPNDIKIESGILSQEQAQFFNTFYMQGLGEFSVKNQVELKINFPWGAPSTTHCHNLTLSPNTFVPIGGGKDSCVTIELLKRTNHPITTFSVGYPLPIKNCSVKSKQSHITLTRTISPELLALNNTGRVYNGHVPITGLIAFLLWISAILYDHRYVAMSCERSANSPNLFINDLPINHQYSKSLSFEQDFWELTHSVIPDFHYFSLLRPLSEMHIAKLFAANCSDYFDIFTSCNKAFKLDETKRLNHWCGNCDKCRFVFLILAPFMDKEKLIQVVGNNPLNDISQEIGFAELLGISGHKPFECVGEISECCHALTLLSTNPKWKDDYIVKHFINRISDNDKDIFTPSLNHLIPEDFQNVMEQFKS